MCKITSVLVEDGFPNVYIRHFFKGAGINQAKSEHLKGFSRECVRPLVSYYITLFDLKKLSFFFLFLDWFNSAKKL